MTERQITIAINKMEKEKMYVDDIEQWVENYTNWCNRKKLPVNVGKSLDKYIQEELDWFFERRYLKGEKQ